MISHTFQLRDMLFFFAAGAASVVPFLYLNIRWARRLGFIDWPKARGLADEQVPIVGHSLILVSVIVALVLTIYYSLSAWFLSTAVIMGVMGYLDDRRPLPALDKIFLQVFCATAVVFLDPQLREAMTDRYGAYGIGLTIFFIVGLINAINFIDGIDGLAGIVIFSGALGFLLIASESSEQYPYFVYAAILMGMMVPFLYVNVFRRRGFLGNVGSYFFSYVLALMHVSVPLPSSGPMPRLAISGLCFVVPIADAIMVICIRLLTGRSPFHADKGHLHHRLVQANLSLRYILLSLGVIELASVMVAWLLSHHSGLLGTLLPVVVGLSQIVIVAMMILFVEHSSRRRLQGYFQRLDAGAPVFFVKYQLAHADGSPIQAMTLRRVEARVAAEIRVADLCYREAPDKLFVALCSMPEPLKGISGRIDSILQNESLSARVVIEQGEIVKVAKARPEFPVKRIA